MVGCPKFSISITYSRHSYLISSYAGIYFLSDPANAQVPCIEAPCLHWPSLIKLPLIPYHLHHISRIVQWLHSNTGNPDLRSCLSSATVLNFCCKRRLDLFTVPFALLFCIYRNTLVFCLLIALIMLLKNTVATIISAALVTALPATSWVFHFSLVIGILIYPTESHCPSDPWASIGDQKKSEVWTLADGFVSHFNWCIEDVRWLMGSPGAMDHTFYLSRT